MKNEHGCKVKLMGLNENERAEKIIYGGGKKANGKSSETGEHRKMSEI